MYKESKITGLIIGKAIEVHSALGPGLLESSYQRCLKWELENIGLQVESERPIPVICKEVHLDCGYRADLIVEQKVLVELKSVEALTDVHVAQVLTYLRFGGFPVGLLINFNVKKLTDGIRRLVL